MGPTTEEIKFCTDKCPILGADGWEWLDSQAFLHPKACLPFGAIKFTAGTKRQASITVYYYSNGQASWFSVTIRGDYPSFEYYQNLDVDMAVSTSEFCEAVIVLSKVLIIDNLEEIVEKGRKHLAP